MAESKKPGDDLKNTKISPGSSQETLAAGPKGSKRSVDTQLDIQRKRVESQTKAVEKTTALKKLSPAAQGLALAGFSKDAEIVELPSTLKLVAISIPFDRTDEISTILEASSCVRPLAPNTKPKVNSGFPTRYYLVPAGGADKLMELASSRNLPISIAVAPNSEYAPTKLMKIGATVVPLQQNLVEEAQKKAQQAEDNNGPILTELSSTAYAPSAATGAADSLRSSQIPPSPRHAIIPPSLPRPSQSPQSQRQSSAPATLPPISLAHPSVRPTLTPDTIRSAPPSMPAIGATVSMPAAEIHIAAASDTIPAPAPITEFTGDGILTEALLYASATSDQGNGETTQGADRPRKGPCSYLDIDFSKLLEPGADPNLIQRLFLTLQELPTEDFKIVPNENGGLRIITLADAETEKTGQAVLFFAAELLKTTYNSVVCYPGTAEITHSERDQSYMLKGAIDYDTFAEVKKMGPGIHSTSEDFSKLLKARDNTVLNCVSEVNVNNPQFLKLVPKKPPVRFRGGHEGPRELIGAEEIMFQLRQMISPGSTVRLGILTGNRGMGKSRILEELLGNNKNALCFAASPERRNRDGGGLITLLEEMDLNLRKKLNGYEELLNGTKIGATPVETAAKSVLKYLDQFAKLPALEKRKLVTENPENMVNLFISAVDIFEKINNVSAIVAVDDCHHMDSFSDPYFTDAIKKILRRNKKTKVLQAYRPEQRYVSNNQRELEASMQAELASQNASWGAEEYVRRVSLVDENEKPYFDLSETKNAQAFVRKTFKPEFEDWDFGSWPQEIGALCPSPLHFATFLNTALQEKSGYIIYDSANRSIDIARPGAIILMEKIRTNLGAHYIEVATKLSEEARNILYCLSLVSGNLNADQILEVVKDTFGGDVNMEVFNELANKGLVSSQKDQQGNTTGFQLFHETIGESILEDMLGGAERTALANCIYEKFGKSDQIPAKAMLTILKYADFPLGEEENWGNFAANAFTVFTETEENRDYQAGYELGAMLMYGLGEKYLAKGALKSASAANKTETNFARAVDLLRKGPAAAEPGTPPLGENVKSCVLESLKAVVKNGVYVGRFKEAFQAIDILAEIQEQGTAVPEIDTIFRLGMRAAQIQMDWARMAKYKKILAANSGEELTVEKIRDEVYPVYGQGNFDEAISILQSYEKPLQAELKAGRMTKNEITTLEQMKLHIGTEKVLRNIASLGVDEDVRLDPVYLADEESKELLIASLQKVKELQADNENLDPFHELGLMEREGQLCALLGCYTKASQVWSKLWAKAMSMGIYPFAQRAAFFRANITAQQAYETVKEPDRTPKTSSDVGSTEPLPNSQIRVSYLQDAYKINRNEAKEASDKLAIGDHFRFSTALNGIRYAGTILTNYQVDLEEAKSNNAIRAGLKLKFGAMITAALADFREMNLPQYSHVYTNKTETGTTYKGSLIFDLSYIGEIMEWANVLNLKEAFSEDEELPLIDMEVTTSAHEYLGQAKTNMDFDILGEIDRKRLALGKLDYYAGKLRIKKLKPGEVS